MKWLNKIKKWVEEGNTPEGSAKATLPGCPQGAVCAWEFNGSLYPTKQARDRAIIEVRKEKLRRKLQEYMEYGHTLGSSYTYRHALECSDEVRTLTAKRASKYFIDNLEALMEVYEYEKTRIDSED